MGLVHPPSRIKWQKYVRFNRVDRKLSFNHSQAGVELAVSTLLERAVFPLLNQLSVRNFTLVKSLDIEFREGMTAITGETGAGKSILLNALGLTLGDRADYDQIRNGEERAEVHAAFDTSNNARVTAFLEDQELNEKDGQCLLRRVINANGNSKAWINGQPVTLTTLRQLAEKLINIHSQHEHQRLTNKEQQLDILDGYAGHVELLESTTNYYGRWKTAEKALAELEENQDSLIERQELLSFQVAELEDLSLKQNEYPELEKEQHQLANAEAILKSLHQLSMLLSENDEFNLVNSSDHALQIAQSVEMPNEHLSEAIELIGNAKIQVEEARDSVRHATDAIELNPQRLKEVETRISTAFDLARKHRVPPNELPDYQQQLSEELAQLQGSADDLESYRSNVSELKDSYNKAACSLNDSRKQHANRLQDAVNHYFEQLGMAGADLSIELAESNPSSAGGVIIDFLVRTNPGATPKPISKVASGGELSRISLAIQVVVAKTNDSPTLVFDEVDVGIGGATAAVVGELLRNLGDRSQVICVTHLAQVASQAHHQLGVEKRTESNHTETQIQELDDIARTQEIARMVGGAELTDQSLAHADRLLRSG